MKKKLFFEISILFLLGLIPLLWFKGNTVILGHDSGLPLDPVIHFVDRLYVWSQRFGIGTDQSYALLGAFFIHGLEAFLSFLGLSLQLEQKIQFIFWFTMPALAMYFFVWKTWPEKKYMAMVSAIIYMINYYLIQGWFIAERTKFSIYIALPLVMYFLIAYLTKRTNFLPSILFAGLTLGFFNGGGSFPLYGGLIVAILVTYVYINLIYVNLETLKRTMLFSLGVSIIYILLNTYWLVTYYYYVVSFYGRDLAVAGGKEGVLTWVTYLSKGSTLLNLLKGQGIPEWYLNDFHPYAEVVLKNPLFKLASFSLTFLAVFSLVIAKLKKDLFYMYLVTFIALVAILLSAGTNSPYGFIFEALVRFMPGFVIFRSAYYKFDYAAWFSFAILIGFAIDYLLVKADEKKIKIGIFKLSNLLLALFICIYLAYHFPILNGLFFDYNNNPKGKVSTRITVPDYVFAFGRWANKQDPNKRYLVFPEINDSTYISYTWGFWSLASINSLLVKNSFVQNTALLSSSERLLMKQMYKSFLNEDFSSFLDFADIFAIDSIIVQKDYDWQNPTWGTVNPQKYENILQSHPELFTKEETFGQWDVYKIVGREKSLRISISHSLNFLQGELGDIVSFPYFDPKIPLYMGSENSADDSFFANSATGIFVGSNCIGCDMNEEDNGFVIYNPTLLPGSFLYNFVVTRSENKVKQKANDFSSRVNYYLTTADRRSIEIKWMVEFRRNLSELQHTLERQNDSLRGLKLELSSVDWGIDSAQSDELVKKIIGHLLSEASIISSVHNDPMVDLQNRRTLASSYELMNTIMDMIKNKQWVTENASVKKYLYRLPLLGEYDIYIKKGSLANPKASTDQASLFIREQGKVLKPKDQVKDWIYFGKDNFSSNILHVAFTDPTVENLLDTVTPVFPSGNSGLTKLADSYVMTGDSIDKCLSFPIHNLDVKEKYMVAFNYRTFTDVRTLSFSIDRGVRQNASLRTKETLLPSKQNWTAFKAAVSPGKSDIAINFCNGFTSVNELEGTAPWLNFETTTFGQITPNRLPDQELGIRETEIRDISVSKLSQPTIIFYKKTEHYQDGSTWVNFIKKNPVEYDVTLEKTTIPTFVTMRESYGKYWQVCDEHSTCLTFDSKLHFADAGFANTWYFEKGVSSKLNFYFYPQKTFLIGAIVSIVSFVTVLGWIVYYKTKKKFNKKNG